MTDLARDLRFASRQLLKSPAFALVCVLTIALGIGANTAVFSVANAVLLRYLPVPNPDELVLLHLGDQPLHTSQTGYNDTSLSMPMYRAMKKQSEVFSAVIGFVPIDWQRSAVRIGDTPEEAFGEMVSGSFFTGLRVRPYAGRVFTEADENEHSTTAVLNYRWWKQRFAADPGVIGNSFRVKGVPVTIVGIAPEGFNGADTTRDADFWIPLQNRPDLTAWGMSPGVHTLYGTSNWLCMLVAARLRPGISKERAAAAIAGPFEAALFGDTKPSSEEFRKARPYLTAMRGMQELQDNYREPLYFLMTMVGLVLAIACLNVAMLMIARNANRSREFAVRLALGASKAQIFRQLLIESSLIVAAGTALGFAVAPSATQALSRWSNTSLSVTPDRTVLLFTFGLASLVTIVFGIAPMRSAAGVPLNSAMKLSAATANTDRSRSGGRKLAVALQIAFCFVLLTGASLLFSTLRNLQNSDLGLKPDGLLVFGINPQKVLSGKAGDLPFHRELMRRIGEVPGVAGVTALELRLGGGTTNNDSVLVDGKTPLSKGGEAHLRSNNVGPNFLRVMGIPLLYGRDITESDTPSSEKVALVSELFVKRYLGQMNPIGHKIQLLEGSESYTIVGVAKDIRYSGVREKPQPMAFFPYSQISNGTEKHYAVRTRGNPSALMPSIARTIRDYDPEVPMQNVKMQRAQFDESVSTDRLTTNLASCFAILAAILVAIGLYGTLAYQVSRRRVEIGLRMAIGAQRRSVVWMVLRESLAVAAIGLAAGVPFALAGSRAMRSLLFGLLPTDWRAYSVAFAGVVVVTLLAAFSPAHRAASIDPLDALRTE